MHVKEWDVVGTQGKRGWVSTNGLLYSRAVELLEMCFKCIDKNVVFSERTEELCWTHSLTRLSPTAGHTDPSGTGEDL